DERAVTHHLPLVPIAEMCPERRDGLDAHRLLPEVLVKKSHLRVYIKGRVHGRSRRDPLVLRVRRRGVDADVTIARRRLEPLTLVGDVETGPLAQEVPAGLLARVGHESVVAHAEDADVVLI